MEDAVDPECSVLVVDDDALSREVIALLLDAAGYAVRCVAGGDEAVRLLSGATLPAEIPGVILADLQMPGLAGRALAQRLRALCGERTRLFVMSAGEPRADEMDLYDCFLRKPLSAEALGQALQQTGEERRVAAADSLAPEPSALPVLDEAVFGKLTHSMGAEALRELYRFSVRDLQQRVAQMRDAMRDDDCEALRRQAHMLRGGAGMVGASEIAALAARLEEVEATTWSSLELEQQLDGLAAGCERLRSMLEAR